MMIGNKMWKLLLLLVPLLLLTVAGAGAGPSAVPTVNGLFYGDGDNSNYNFLAENPGRGKLYTYQDGNTLYVAVVVGRAANDNVFGDTGDAEDTNYVQSAGWSGGGANHRFSALLGSEHMQFNFQCDNGAIDETWTHGYLYDSNGNADPAENDWLSGPGDGSTGSAPPANVTLIATASSLMWNLNYFASVGSPGWDITLGGARSSTNDYKSPGDGDADEDVTDEIGYPASGDITFDTTNNWEWPVVYEFSLNITNCGGTPYFLNVISAHNSPSKDNVEDIPIPARDFGDLPDTYNTELANTGAYHEIELGGTQLGSTISGESDGAPTSDATGDDNTPAGGPDDEDGVVATPNSDWSDGMGEIDVTVSNAGGCLNVWVDFLDDTGPNPLGDGDFDDTFDTFSEHVIQNQVVSVGTTTLDFELPIGAADSGQLAVRSRLTPLTDGSCDDSAYAGNAPSSSGAATGGEVEDNIFNFSPTAVSLAAFSANQPPLSLLALTLLALVATIVVSIIIVFNRQVAG